MPRTIRDTKLDTRSARARLKQRREPYWTQISPGCHLGYRRSGAAGSWIAKWRDTTTAKRQQQALGAADDILDDDGINALSFHQAQAKAHAWYALCAKAAGGGASTSRYTVNDALDDYMEWFRAHRKSLIGTQHTVNAHIRPGLGKVCVSNLTTQQLRQWHTSLATAPPRRRRPKGVPPPVSQYEITDPELLRCRKVTANRILTVLKAALNHAYREGKAASDDAWRRLRPFPNAESARTRFLSEDECRRLVNACDGDFRRLVQGALLTGCRYSELAGLLVGDFDRQAGTLFIRDSKSRHSRHVYLTEEGRELFANLTAGRTGPDRMFVRSDGQPWGKNHQARVMQEASAHARLVPMATFHVLRHTYASLLVMRNAPLAVIARNLGHADTRMVEKHYGHLAPNYVAETIRAHFPKLGIIERSNVVALG